MAAAEMMVCVDDFEEYAKQHLPYNSWVFYSCGADSEDTLRSNRTAYGRYLLKPRVLRDVSTIDMSTTILGSKVDAPICIAPSALHGLAHPDAESATATAAADMNTIMMMSLMSNKSMEDIVAEKQNGMNWMNIFMWSDREVTIDVVKRAENAGFKAIAVSVDVPQLGVKRRLKQIGGMLQLSGVKLGNVEPYFLKFTDSKDKIPGELVLGNPACTWEDIKWLQTITKLPIVLKGILAVEDAVLAAQYGVQGIVVSNHGGRQLDGVPATIDVLADIVQAVGDTLEVYVDGGIRQGTDVLKALALGARAVFIGRPVLYGLTHKGAEGVKQVLQILNDELSTAMALSGCSKISDITPSLLKMTPTSSQQL
ncbi:2-Hydroxyacid oxidase 2-like [Glandiceps talaboti]